MNRTALSENIGGMLSPERCPPDPEQTAEAYLLHQLDRPDARAFEDHYATCARCAEALEATEEYVLTLKRATARLRAAAAGA